MPKFYKQLKKSHSEDERARLLERAARVEGAADEILNEARRDLTIDSDHALLGATMAVELAERRQNNLLEAAAHRTKAQALRIQNRHPEAIDAFEAAFRTALRVGDELLVAQVQIGKIDSLCWIGKYDEAISLAKRLILEFQTLKSREDEAKVLVNLGSVYFRQDRYAESLSCYRAALGAITESGDPIAIAGVQQNLANILAQLDQVAEAIQLFAAARDAFVDRNIFTYAAKVDANTGYLYFLSGEYTSALASLSRARLHFSTQGQEFETAKCDADLADVYRAVNLYPESLACYERAIEVFSRNTVPYELARAEHGRAVILMTGAQIDEALSELERAEKIFQAQKNSVQRANVRLTRGYLFRHHGNLDAVRAEAEAAKRTFTRHRLLAWAAEANFLLADLAIERGEDATAAMLTVSRSARLHARGWLESRAECALGELYLKKGQASHALRHLRQAVSALEAVRTTVAPEELHVSYFSDKLAVYERLVSALLKRGRTQDIREAFEYVERSKSRLLLERVQAALDGKLTVRGTGSTTLQERLASLRADLSRGYRQLQSTKPDAARGMGLSTSERLGALEALEHEYRTTLRDIELAEVQPAVMQQTSVHRPEAMSTALDQDEALVEYYVVDNAVCAFILTRSGLQLCPHIARLSEVEAASRRLRYHLQKVSIAEDYQTRHDKQLLVGTQQVLVHLYDLLLKPIEGFLSTGKIILVPYGALHGLPFHAFHNGTDHALDRWEFTYAPSASVWYARAQREKRRESIDTRQSFGQALIMGVPDASIGKVVDEVEYLRKMLPDAQVFCGEEATVEAFRAHCGTAKLIHLATHAMFRDDNPLFSGLQFADGWLLARDLYEQILDCDLATLSACRTGVSSVEPGDEIFGLIRGFMAAGARSLAVSLWPTDDVSTASLMADFYTLLSQGTPKAAALAAAQRHLREQNPHPYYWAAFALIGER